MISFIDLFAGIGGIRLGFENACNTFGIETKCVLSSEIDTKACETYELNFGEYPSGDIYQINEIPRFDFLLAGFPCQPFSYAGKQQGFGDTRGTLFFEIERILSTHKPTAFLLENVRGLVTHDKGRTFKTILTNLENLGYGVDYLLLNSCNFKIPQNRVRLYIVGILGKKPRLTLQSDLGSADSHIFKSSNTQLDLFKEHEFQLVRDILETTPGEQYMCSDDFVRKLSKVVGTNYESLHGYRLIDYRGGSSIHSWELGIKGDCTSEEIEFMNSLIANRRKKKFGTHQDGKKLTLEQIKTFFDKPHLLDTIQSLVDKGYLQKDDDKYNPVCGNMSFEVFKFLDPDSISITLTSSDANRLGIVQNNLVRRITPRECARLQGFPDRYICHPNDTYAYKQFGNSVTVPVVEAVLKDLLDNNQESLGFTQLDEACG
ncbi:DNA (cytosine-5-)-methyltransferase [Phosphitispora fastidiosa]|uniref:DNA (cytosine-5-)-methyltransferase n=1 Tax=Phosphitispora fastidiosa TaxID=2837202 RepID=UPI001E4FDB0E|nr:DNA (cytosine-5-)-methyltransferase [Phosphitispora fastidiosa]MBU7005310.1 DNA (cytosine-5)-methyltransferase 1 [Phosphitispora fastidiosa]